MVRYLADICRGWAEADIRIGVCQEEMAIDTMKILRTGHHKALSDGCKSKGRTLDTRPGHWMPLGWISYYLALHGVVYQVKALRCTPRRPLLRGQELRVPLALDWLDIGDLQR